MPFEKGHKHGKGRPKGSENKLNQEARELFVETLEGLTPSIKQAFLDVLQGTKNEDGEWEKKPNPEKFLELYAKYAQYFVPKKTEADIKGEIRGSIDFNEIVKKLRGDK